LKVLITGVTGIVGSSISKLMLEAGHRVNGLARPDTDVSPLRALGVTIHRGDVAKLEDIVAAGHDCEALFHCAAVLGGPNADPVQMEAANVLGTTNALEAARTLSMRRVIAFGSPVIFDNSGGPYTERSPLVDATTAAGDPYTRTKTEAFRRSRKCVEAGQDIVMVVPGGIFGPTPMIRRSMTPPSNNLRIVWAIRREVRDYIDFPVPWSYSEDVAQCAVAALDKGRAGDVFLAFGRPEDATGMAGFMDRVCRVAGINHRVKALGPQELDSPEAMKRFGPTLINKAKLKHPTSLWDHRHTLSKLGLEPLSMDEGISRTIHALQEAKLL